MEMDYGKSWPRAGFFFRRPALLPALLSLQRFHSNGDEEEEEGEQVGGDDGRRGRPKSRCPALADRNVNVSRRRQGRR